MLPSNLLRVAAAFAVGAESQKRDDSAIPKSATTGASLASVTSSTSTPTHTVAVGAEGSTYTPQQVKKASVGDIIEFRFYPGGHTVVRAEFGYPCIPYEYTGVNKIGFYSGKKSPQVIMNDPPSFQVRVNDTDPVFFYCSAPFSCTDHHMVGVINPSANETFDKQQEFAKKAPYQLAPGDPFPTETSKSTPTPSSSSSPGGAPGPASDNGGGHHLSTGAIAGIAIGAAAVLVLGGGLIYMCGWRYARGASRPRSTQTLPPTSMVDAKFSPSPNSPDPGTGSMPRYSIPPGNDPYRTQSPPHAYGRPPSSIDPNSHPAYGMYSDPRHPSSHSPLMGTDAARGSGFHHGEQLTPTLEHAQLQISPVELPTSSTTGNSPLPAYRERYSWSQGSEAQYRPGHKS